MPFTKVLNVVSFIDHCIRNNKPLRVYDIAEQLGISERHVFNYLKAMKRKGAPIEYDRKSHSFYYTESGYFHIGFIKQKYDNRS